MIGSFKPVTGVLGTGVGHFSLPGNNAGFCAAIFQKNREKPSLRLESLTYVRPADSQPAALPSAQPPVVNLLIQLRAYYDQSNTFLRNQTALNLQLTNQLRQALAVSSGPVRLQAGEIERAVRKQLYQNGEFRRAIDSLAKEVKKNGDRFVPLSGNTASDFRIAGEMPTHSPGSGARKMPAVSQTEPSVQRSVIAPASLQQLPVLEPRRAETLPPHRPLDMTVDAAPLKQRRRKASPEGQKAVSPAEKEEPVPREIGKKRGRKSAQSRTEPERVEPATDPSTDTRRSTRSTKKRRNLFPEIGMFLLGRRKKRWELSLGMGNPCHAAKRTRRRPFLGMQHCRIARDRTNRIAYRKIMRCGPARRKMRRLSPQAQNRRFATGTTGGKPMRKRCENRFDRTKKQGKQKSHVIYWTKVGKARFCHSLPNRIRSIGLYQGRANCRRLPLSGNYLAGLRQKCLAWEAFTLPRLIKMPQQNSHSRIRSQSHP